MEIKGVNTSFGLHYKYFVVFCSLFLGHDKAHYPGLLLAALGRGVKEGVQQEGGVMPVGHHLCKSCCM